MHASQSDITSHPEIRKNIDTYLTLFNTQIKPILLYACEGWSETIKGNIDDTTLLTKNNEKNSK